jgi:hypothetical protein
VQREKNINVNEGEERINDFFFKLHLQEESGNMIVELHYVGHFIL